MEIIHFQYPDGKQATRPPSSVAFGTFDGVHHGHQQVIGQAIAMARKHQLQAGVMTFHPHPKEVLGKVEHSTYLTPLEDKLKLLEEFGVDFVMVVQFTPDFAKLSPDEFIRQCIVNLHIQHVVCGFDFCFGYRGKGTIQHLQEWSQEHGDFDVHVVSSVDQENQKISSSRIRLLLEQGEVDRVSTLLHRYYHITGKVIHGEKRGRTLGFPTANLKPFHSYVLPRQGVYAVWVDVRGSQYRGVVNIGVKPTFHTDQLPSIEAHILEFDQHIYDEEVTIRFVSFLRGEMKFESLEQLKDQITQDIQRAIGLLTPFCGDNKLGKRA